MAKNKFSELINSSKPVLVDFYAEWCGPCKGMKPVLEELKSKVGSTASIIKIDVDKNQQLAAVYKIRSVPTLMLFKNGRIVWQQAGTATLNQLTQLIVSNS